jgi:hypothetical protein
MTACIDDESTNFGAETDGLVDFSDEEPTAPLSTKHRRDTLRDRIKDVPLSRFTASQFADLSLLYSERSLVDVLGAIERLEPAVQRMLGEK